MFSYFANLFFDLSLYMISIYDFHLSSFILRYFDLQLVSYNLKLSFLFHHAQHSKRLVSCYILSFFIIPKFPYLIGQLAGLKKMTFIKGQNCLVQASKVFTGHLSNRFDNRDHANPLESNKSEFYKISIRPEVLARLAALAGLIFPTRPH